MAREIHSDIIIFGGGIAGLWLLGRLREAGYSALLLESRALGGVQTSASQGIVHGGTKYALTGKLTGAMAGCACFGSTLVKLAGVFSRFRAIMTRNAGCGNRWNCDLIAFFIRKIDGGHFGSQGNRRNFRDMADRTIFVLTGE